MHDQNVKFQDAAKPEVQSTIYTALVIGNAHYHHVPALVNATSDARRVAARLRDVGYTSVTLKENLGRAGFARTLKAFARAADKSDVAVIYYAGHGIEIDGANYLVPVDARLAHEREVGLEAVHIDDLVTAVDGANLLRMAVLDACRNNPFDRDMERRPGTATRSLNRGLAEFRPASNVVVAYSAKHGTTAIDGAAGLSPFAQAFIEELPQWKDVRLVFGRIRDRVLELTEQQQEPHLYGSMGGDEIYLRPRPQQPEPVPGHEPRTDPPAQPTRPLKPKRFWVKVSAMIVVAVAVASLAAWGWFWSEIPVSSDCPEHWPDWRKRFMC